MVNTNALRACFVLNGKTFEDVAKVLGISTKTLSLRFKKGVFGSDEIEKMIDYLNIDDPMPIFFAK